MRAVHHQTAAPRVEGGGAGAVRGNGSTRRRFTCGHVRRRRATSGDGLSRGNSRGSRCWVYLCISEPFVVKGSRVRGLVDGSASDRRSGSSALLTPWIGDPSMAHVGLIRGRGNLADGGGSGRGRGRGHQQRRMAVEDGTGQRTRSRVLVRRLWRSPRSGQLLLQRCRCSQQAISLHSHTARGTTRR